jgi:hypothetical protein
LKVNGNPPNKIFFWKEKIIANTLLFYTKPLSQIFTELRFF